MTKKKQGLCLTVDGKQLPRDKVRYLQGKYYEPGVSCFKLTNEKGKERWVRKDSPWLGFNAETNTYDYISKLKADTTLVQGIIDNDNKTVFFKKDPNTNVLLLDSRNSSPMEAVLCKNAELATKLGYVECLHNEFWYKKSNLSASDLDSIKKKLKVNYPNKLIDYNANNNNRTFRQISDEYASIESKIPIGNSTEIISKFLGKYSFGIEFETSTGTIPEPYLGPLGLLPVRDGSISGYEYTTIPLKGPAGLQTLKSTCKELSKRCMIDHKCSMHIHIGNIQRTKLFIIAFYMLAYKLQDELFEMFPGYKQDQVKYLGSPKNYCQKLPDLKLGTNKIFSSTVPNKEIKIQNNFNKIFTYLSGGTPEGGRYNFESFVHPQDENGRAKWQRTARYHFLNLIPTIFDQSKTIEFRLHTPTVNFTKTSNWLFISLALIKFCEQNQDKIIARKIKFDLNSILDGYKNDFGRLSKESEIGSTIAEYLKAYVESRKETFKTAITVNKDYICSSELRNDPTYSFEFKGVKTLY